MVSFIPLIGDLLLPVRLISKLVDSVLDDGEGLSDFIILHVLLVVEFICELKQIVDLCLLRVLSLTFSHGPGGLSTLLAFLAGNRGCLTTLYGSRLGVQIGSCERLGLG